MKAKTLSSLILLLAVAACQQFASTARAAVSFSVTPSAVSNFYAGPITLQVSGLNPGETVQIDKFMDANANGVIDAGDLPVQSFLLTDGQASVFGGVTNINVPGDLNPTNGVITAQLSIARDVTQQIVAKHLFRLSSPTSRFTPITNLFNVTNSPYAQSFTGTVRNGGTNVPNVVVMVTPANSQKGGPLAGVMADNAGSYTLNLPSGTYSFWLFKSNFVANLSQSPMLTLTNGATFTTNLHFLMPATTNISGHVVDAANTNTGVPGLFMICQTLDKQLMAGGCYTGTNGTFSVPVTAGQWKVEMASEGLAAYGYLGLQNRPQVDTTTGSVSIATIALPKATALFYGTVLDSQSHPLAGLDMYCSDNNQQYEGDYYTDTNGYFVAPVAADATNSSWQVQVSSDVAPANYLFSQPSFNQNGGTNLSAGQAVLANFTAVLATNHISGWLKDSSGNPIGGVGISANATINGVDYHQGSVSTDTNGNYSLNVANGTWTVEVSTCSGCNDGLPGNYLSPANQSVVISNNNGTVNFTALSATNHITGHVQQDNGNPIAGVGVGASATINGVDYMLYMDTEANGNYSFNVANGIWTVGLNPSSGSDSLDSILGIGNYQGPDNQTVNITNNNGTANITVQLNTGFTNSISGSLTDNNGSPIAGVGVWASATINGVPYNQGGVSTDANGNYSLNVPNGTWTVGVSGGGGSGQLPVNYLMPPTQTVVIDNNNGTANFIAILAPNHITGTIKDNSGNPIIGVGVTANTTFAGVYYYQNCQTNSTPGGFSLNVPNGTWSVGLSIGGGSGALPTTYLFPASQSVVISNNNGTANFIVLVPTHTITGHVQQDNGTPIGGLGLWGSTLINGTNYYQVGNTDAGGNYSLNVVNASWSVVVDTAGSSASLDSIFGSGNYQDPGSQNVTINNNNGTANFTVQVFVSPVADVVDYYVLKMESFLQVDPANFVLNTNFGPFTAYLGLVQSAPDVVPIANVSLPTGSERALPWGSSGQKLQTLERFASQASIDAAYPPGNYTFGLYCWNDGLQFPVLLMPSAAYPNPPHVSNFNAAQAINPLSSFTLQWDAITGTTTNDTLSVVVTGTDVGIVFSTPDPGTDHLAALPGTATSVVIPTNTFQTGHAYTAWVTLFRETSVNMTAYPGAAGVTLVAAQTSLPLAMNSGSPRPRLDLAERQSANQFRFQLSGMTNQNYTVQVSTNLASTNWFTLLTTNLSASPVFIQDNQATNKQRFYRVKVGP